MQVDQLPLSVRAFLGVTKFQARVAQSGQTINAMYNKGWSYADMAKELSVGTGTLVVLVNEMIERGDLQKRQLSGVPLAIRVTAVKMDLSGALLGDVARYVKESTGFDIPKTTLRSWRRHQTVKNHLSPDHLKLLTARSLAYQQGKSCLKLPKTLTELP